MYHYTSFS